MSNTSNNETIKKGFTQIINYNDVTEENDQLGNFKQHLFSSSIISIYLNIKREWFFHGVLANPYWS